MRKLLLFILLFLVWLMPAQGGMSLECEVPVLSGAELVEAEGGHHYATWYRNRHYSSELAGKSVDKSSPSDNCFYGGKNLVVYNETLQSIDVLSLALSPLGLDWIADGFGAIYAGYYGDELNATLYGTAVFLPIISYSAIKITGKNLLKGLLTGNSELVKDGSGFVVREVVQGAGNLVPNSLITKLTQQGADKLKAWTSARTLNYKSLNGSTHTGISAEAKIFEDLESAIGNKNVLATIEDGQGRLSVVLERPGQTHQVVSVHPTSTSELKMTTFEPAYNPNLNPSIPVPASANKLVPDYAGTQYLHPLNQGKVIKIKMTGKRTGSTGDFAKADAEMKKFDPNFVKPTGYTWHHLDDFNPITGECTMQLVESTAHQGSGVVGMSHSGSVAQWKAYYVSSSNAPNNLFYQQ